MKSSTSTTAIAATTLERRSKTKLNSSVIAFGVVLFNILAVTVTFYHSLNVFRITSDENHSPSVRSLGNNIDYHSRPVVAFASSHKDKRHKLGFVHIPKTGGTSIEVAGAAAGLNWGSCMFKPLLEHDNVSNQAAATTVTTTTNTTNNNNAVACPTQELLQRYQNRHVPRNVRYSLAPWHAPIKCLPTPYYKDMFQELFAVVRNPYTRMLSEYYFACQDFGSPKCTAKTKNDALFMNAWIQQQIRKQASMKNPECDQYARGHFIRQYDFLVSKAADPQHQQQQQHTRLVVPHVLKMEQLDQDFAVLMTAKNVKVTLPKQQEKRRDIDQDTLTIHDFTAETVKLIKDFYAKDFEIGNYSLELP